MSDLIDRLWIKLNVHRDLALEAEEQGYDVALEYHTCLAQKYQAMIEAFLKRQEDARGRS